MRGTKMITNSRRCHYLVRLSIFLITAALIAGTAGCDGCGYNPPPSQNLEIRTWYDLDAIRDNLAGDHVLMNDLDSTTHGYEEIAGRTANGGKGWQPIRIYHPHGGTIYTGFIGTFDGQGYEIRDLYINRPDEDVVGLFGLVDAGGSVIQNIGMVKATVIGHKHVGGLVGYSQGTVRNSSYTGSVTGVDCVGGLAGANSGTVINCYSNGTVSGIGWGVGGLVGSNFDTVSKCYSTGSVIGEGGLVGGNRVTVSNSFWDIETSGQATSAGGTGKTTAEMKDIITFLDAGWDIVAVANPDTRDASCIWNIVDGQTYPFLSWEPIS